VGKSSWERDAADLKRKLCESSTQVTTLQEELICTQHKCQSLQEETQQLEHNADELENNHRIAAATESDLQYRLEAAEEEKVSGGACIYRKSTTKRDIVVGQVMLQSDLEELSIKSAEDEQRLRSLVTDMESEAIALRAQATGGSVRSGKRVSFDAGSDASSASREEEEALLMATITSTSTTEAGALLSTTAPSARMVSPPRVVSPPRIVDVPSRIDAGGCDNGYMLVAHIAHTLVH
jgi:chromosome segregation ATPase